MSGAEEALLWAIFGKPICQGCGHMHTDDGCVGDPTTSDLWAGVSPSACDCMDIDDHTPSSRPDVESPSVEAELPQDAIDASFAALTSPTRSESPRGNETRNE